MTESAELQAVFKLRELPTTTCGYAKFHAWWNAEPKAQGSDNNELLEDVCDLFSSSIYHRI